MKKLLITGFEPFGGEQINPSWQSVLRLPDEIGDYKLTKLCIPVIFGEGAERVLKTAKELSPDVILCVGQAGGRKAITPEFLGINLRHAEIPDNKGNQPKDEQIIKLALLNLRYAGAKRNRGFGKIKCTINKGNAEGETKNA